MAFPNEVNLKRALGPIVKTRSANSLSLRYFGARQIGVSENSAENVFLIRKARIHRLKEEKLKGSKVLHGQKRACLTGPGNFYRRI